MKLHGKEGKIKRKTAVTMATRTYRTGAYKSLARIWNKLKMNWKALMTMDTGGGGDDNNRSLF